MGRERKFNLTELFQFTRKLVTQVGYEGFTIGQLASQLNISRAAIYKYYQNKDEVLLDFMIEEMKNVLKSFSSISEDLSFHQKIDLVLEDIFKYKDLHFIFGILEMIPNKDAMIEEKKKEIVQMHLHLYNPLKHVVEQGKNEGYIDSDYPNDLILGFIFQSISIPNHSELSNEKMNDYTKKLILNGISKIK